VERIRELFGAVPAGPEAVRRNLIEPPQRGEKRVIVKKESPVERLLIGYHVPPVAHPDAYVLQVIEAILSTGKSSRLYQRLVDGDRSVTSASATFHDHIDPSLFYFKAELKPGYKLNDVENAIYDEIEKLQSAGPSERELAKAKAQIEADLVMSHEEPLQQAILLGQYETIAVGERVPEGAKGYRYLNGLIPHARAVTAEDVTRVAKQYFTSDNRTVGHLIDTGKEQASEAA
jgi:zinc protease